MINAKVLFIFILLIFINFLALYSISEFLGTGHDSGVDFLVCLFWMSLSVPLTHVLGIGKSKSGQFDWGSLNLIDSVADPQQAYF